MARNLPITEFDTLTLTDSMQMFKAMIPFLDYSLQRTLSLIIRINEFQQTMQFYQNPDNCHQFSCCSSGNTISWGCSLNDLLSNEQLVNTVLQYCPEKYASMFQSFQQFSKMSEIFNMMNTGNDYYGPNAADIFNKFTSFAGSGGGAPNFSDFFTQSAPDPQATQQSAQQTSQQAAQQQQSAQQTSQQGDSQQNSNQAHSASQTRGQQPYNQQSYAQSNFGQQNNEAQKQPQPNPYNYASYHLNRDSDESTPEQSTGTNGKTDATRNANLNQNNSAKRGPDLGQLGKMAGMGMNPTDMFSSVMTPEQRQLYSQYVSELDKIDFDHMDET